MNRTLLTCPVDGCNWAHDPEQDQEPQRYVMLVSPTPEDISAAVSKVAEQRAASVEAKLREHAESHDVFDFLRTIQRLNQDIAQYDCGIRPHMYRPDTP